MEQGHLWFGGEGLQQVDVSSLSYTALKISYKYSFTPRKLRLFTNLCDVNYFECARPSLVIRET